MNLIADKSVARHIRTKGVKSSVYLFIADQCPVTLDEKFRFSFLNQETYFFSGMEKLARRSNSAVVYLNITQFSRGRYNISVIPICVESASTSEGEITREYARLLAANINSQPHGWLWSHKRWKR